MIVDTYKVSDSARVFFVGDIHGEIVKLLDGLESLGFRKSVDKVFSVGDLIDRGEDSLASLALTTEDWFHCVRGNHEQMAFDALNNTTNDSAAHWMMNGGQWYTGLDYDQKAWADDLIKNHIPKMPHVIEVHHKGKVIVVCHANWPCDKYSRDKNVMTEALIWDRGRIENITRHNDHSPIIGADLFIFGHTPVRRPVYSDNQIWIDTGACFGKELTILEL